MTASVDSVSCGRVSSVFVPSGTSLVGRTVSSSRPVFRSLGEAESGFPERRFNRARALFGREELFPVTTSGPVAKRPHPGKTLFARESDRSVGETTSFDRVSSVFVPSGASLVGRTVSGSRPVFRSLGEAESGSAERRFDGARASLGREDQFPVTTSGPVVKRSRPEKTLFARESDRSVGETISFASAHPASAAEVVTIVPSSVEAVVFQDSFPELTHELFSSPPRGVRLVPKKPSEILKRKVAPGSCDGIARAFRFLEKGSFNVVCIDKKEHEIQFFQEGSGDFNAFCLIYPDQVQILEGVPNKEIGVKIFHKEMPRSDSEIQKRMIDLYVDLRAAGIPCPEIYNAEQFIKGCGYLLVEYVPLSSGPIALEELLALTTRAYEKKLFIDLKFDNLRRTLAGVLKLVDWGGEVREDDDCLDAHFRKILRVLGLEEIAKTSPVLRSLTLF